MKHLIYKELKLAMHPICYVFVFVFPLMALIPTYPMATSLIYIATAYPIIFLGANKGQQSNDLLYTMLLPVRRKDIVFARMITVILMQVVSIFILCALAPLHQFLLDLINAEQVALGQELMTDVGFGMKSLPSLVSVALISFSILDLIFFNVYYKNGKSIVLSTLLGIFGFAIFLMCFTIIPAFIEPINIYLIEPQYLWIQFIILGISIAVYVLLHYLTYKTSYKKLEKVDF